MCPITEIHPGSFFFIIKFDIFPEILCKNAGYFLHKRYGEKNLLLNKFLKYRHYDVNAAVQDAHRAIRYIRANAEK